jgi:hypothetical protein
MTAAAVKRDKLAEQQALKQRRQHIRDDYLLKQDRLEKVDAKLVEAQQVHAKATELLRQAEEQIKEQTGRKEILTADLAKLEAESEENKAALAAIEDEIGKVNANTGNAAPNTAMMEAAAKLGTFTAADLAARLKITPVMATKTIKLYVKDGTFIDTGRKVMGKPLYEHAGAKAEEKADESQQWHDVRDYAVKQKDAFQPSEVTDATEVEGRELTEALQYLIRKGVIEYVGFDGLELYQYIPPKAMGDAAEKDAKKRAAAAKAAPRAQVTESAAGGGPVSGTGHQSDLKISDPEVRALVQAVTNAGGTCTREGGSGHISVRGTANDRRILISSTPRNKRSVMNDRSRIRRELLLEV